MGGHGALACALKNPGKYASVSAFSPICNPIACPWGQKAFSGYLGEDKEAWKVSSQDNHVQKKTEMDINSNTVSALIWRSKYFAL